LLHEHKGLERICIVLEQLRLMHCALNDMAHHALNFEMSFNVFINPPRGLPSPFFKSP
jgi:hypothetical protein